MKRNHMEEILYAQHLAGNDEATRVKTIDQLRKYIRVKSSGKGFTAQQLINLWKGLYYCMYMADKPLFQEEIAEEISNLIHAFSSIEQKCLFFRAAMDTFAREWDGMDVFRADKFMMLMCRVLRQMLVCLKQLDWKKTYVASVVKILEETIITPKDQTNEKPLGAKLHLADIILEELAKIGRSELSHETIITFTYPYMKVLAVSKQNKYVQHVKENVFEWLIKQSKMGAEHQEDLEFGEYELIIDSPENEIGEVGEKSECSNSEDAPLDPRAGGVDVVLPELKPDYGKLASALQALGSSPQINDKRRKLIYSIVKELRTMDQGIYPYNTPLINKKEPPVISKFMKEQAVNRIKMHNQKLQKQSELGDMSRRKKMKLKACGGNMVDEVKRVKTLPQAEPGFQNSRGKLKKKQKKFKKKKATPTDVKEEELRRQDLVGSSFRAEKNATKILSDIARDIGLVDEAIALEEGPSMKERKSKKRKAKGEASIGGSKRLKTVHKESVELGESEVKSLVQSDSTAKPKKKKKTIEKSSKADVSLAKVPRSKVLKKKKSVKSGGNTSCSTSSGSDCHVPTEPGSKNPNESSHSSTIPKMAASDASLRENSREFSEWGLTDDWDICVDSANEMVVGSSKSKSIIDGTSCNKESSQSTNCCSSDVSMKINGKSGLTVNDGVNSVSNLPNSSNSISNLWHQPLQKGEFEFEVKSRKCIAKKKKFKKTVAKSDQVIVQKLPQKVKQKKKSSKPDQRADQTSNQIGKEGSLQNGPKVVNLKSQDNETMQPSSTPDKTSSQTPNSQIRALKSKKNSLASGSKISPVCQNRKLKINLKNNVEHTLRDYKRVLLESPTIPFSSEKKPLVSVLKQTSSPILIKKSVREKLRRRTMNL